GFLLWAGILVFWGRTVLAHLTRLDRSRAILVGACWVGVIGILGHNLVTVTLRHGSAAILFWTLFGIAIGASCVLDNTDSVRRFNWWRWIVLALIVVGGPLVWLHGIREHQADRYLREADNVIKHTLAQDTKRRDLMTDQCHLVLDLLARADRLVPVRKESLYWRAWAFYELGDYKSAQTEYERTIELEGQFVNTVPNIGKSLLSQVADYLALGFRDQALQACRDSLYWWEWACRMDPDNSQHQRNLARALGTLGRTNESREAFNRALNLETDPKERKTIQDDIQQLERAAVSRQ
ncbi:MAG: tetratricopeptide repeat protein, partial [bacterium]